MQVETIGDAYIACSGLERPQPFTHAWRAAGFALDACAVAADTWVVVTESGIEESLSLRAGIHTGSVAAAMLGKRNRKFSLYGDVVNTAARMETAAMPGTPNASADAAKLIAEQAPHLVLSSRGMHAVKGKGHMEMFAVSAPTSGGDGDGDSNPAPSAHLDEAESRQASGVAHTSAGEDDTCMPRPLSRH